MKAVPRVSCSCAGCGVEVLKRQSDLDRLKSGRVFCSAECRKRVGSKPRKRAEKECRACARTFYPSASAGQVYCSKECKDLGSRKHPARRCNFCGEEFTYRSGYRLYCSRACWTKAQYKRPLGRFHNGKPAVLDAAGYVKVYEPDHPKASRSGWVFEHRLVVEGILGRYLDRDEEVHHINHVRHDNTPENLQLMSAAEHRSITGFENGEALRSALAMRQKLMEYERRFGPLPDSALEA